MNNLGNYLQLSVHVSPGYIHYLENIHFFASLKSLGEIYTISDFALSCSAFHIGISQSQPSAICLPLVMTSQKINFLFLTGKSFFSLENIQAFDALCMHQTIQHSIVISSMYVVHETS